MTPPGTKQSPAATAAADPLANSGSVGHVLCVWGGQVGPVGGVLADGVVVGVVDDAQLPHDFTPDGGLDRPVVDVAVLLLAVQLLHVEDLTAQPVEDDADVLDGEVMLLLGGQLVHQQQKLDPGHALVTLNTKNRICEFEKQKKFNF